MAAVVLAVAHGLVVDVVVGRYKLACMSAAASGALQIRIRQYRKDVHGVVDDNGKCHCGDPESLFPIPLIQSYRNVLRLYYGKTFHDREGA